MRGSWPRRPLPSPGPMSRPRPFAPNGVSWIASGSGDLDLRIRPELRGHDDVGRQDDLDAEGLGLGPGSPSRCPPGPSRGGSAPTLWPRATRKVNSIPPPIRSASTFGSKAPITSSLSETFEPPSTTVYGFCGILGEALEHVELLLDEQAGCARQLLRPARRRSPACGARTPKPVRHHHVGEGGQPLREPLAVVAVLRGLVVVEPRDSRAPRLRRARARRLRPRRTCRPCRPRTPPACPGAHRGAPRPVQASTLGLGLALWATEVRDHDHRTLPHPAAPGSWARSARMRPSSVMCPFFNGTFRSQRRMTFLPSSSPRVAAFAAPRG